MIRIRFSIEGNQDDPTGNPVPYTRMLKGHFRKDARVYMAWKEYVRSELDRNAWQDDAAARYKPRYTLLSMPFPELVPAGGKAAVHVFISWKNKRNGDGDNILKGIMDALFKNDKCVWHGSFTGVMAEDRKGRVDVLIELS